EVVLGRLEHVRRDAARLLLDPLQRVVDRDRADGRAAARVRAIAERLALRVAELDGHVLRLDAELLRDHLRDCRLVPLPLLHRAGGDDALAGEVPSAVRAPPHRRAPALAGRSDPRRWRGAADLDVGGEADPDVATLRACGLLLQPEVVVADDLQRA